jgi:hypothetical protein
MHTVVADEDLKYIWLHGVSEILTDLVDISFTIYLNINDGLGVR